MKKFMVYPVLVFLVALQLPKSWLHHHDHEVKVVVNDDQDFEAFDSEDCFVCELTIDSFDGPLLPIGVQRSFVKQKVTRALVQALIACIDLPFDLRGPPIA